MSIFTQKNKTIFFYLIFAFLLLASIFIRYESLTNTAYAAGPVVWVEDGMTRVFKNDPAKTTAAITLYTAKNEYEPFQIVVKAPVGNGLTNVNISVSNLVGPNGAIISSDNLTLYREHYLYVTQGSKHNSSETNRPLGPGWYPDALIPFRDPVTRADLTGSLDAVPFSLAAGVNQPIWVDIFTPPNSLPGTYQGTATVTSAQGTGTVNISLNVWNFSLAKKRSLRATTEAETFRKSRAAHTELLKHRINPKHVNREDERFLIDNYGFDMLRIWLPSGATYNSCQANPPPSVSDVQNLAANHEQDLYLYDSYANEVWKCTNLSSLFLEWATNLRLGGIHPKIVTYPTDALMGTDLNHTAADIWSILPKHYDGAKSNIDKLIANPTTEVWFYNPIVQDGYSPKFTIDFLPINSRIFHSFIGQSLGAKGTKFWRVDNWTSDPWNNAEAYRADAPGDGHMVYPGDNVGLPNQISSGVRMKWFREGSEDYEYIQMLKNLGESQFALNTVRTVATDFHIWSQDKNVLLTARKSFGDKLHSLSGGPTSTPSPTPGLSRTPTPTGSPTAAKLKFKIRLPDILPSVTNISAANIQVEVRDGITSVGLTGVDLVRNGNYFQTLSESSFNIPQNKGYTILVKTITSLRRSFAGINLTQSQMLDCTVTSNAACGELISQRDNKLLLSGDSDGFTITSGSYNKIDSADLQVLASFFNQSATGNAQQADFNLDGSINISDLEILGRNYGGRGD